jgi:hypothetical protein
MEGTIKSIKGIIGKSKTPEIPIKKAYSLGFGISFDKRYLSIKKTTAKIK